MAIQVELSEVHRITVQEYRELIVGGWLDEGTHLELIDGVVVDMSPRTPRHEAAVRWLNHWLNHLAGLDLTQFEIMITGSLTIDTSEPEPDAAVVRKPVPSDDHPSRAALVIEVAVSSRDRDLRTKPALYASAVDEYWVVDLEAQEVVTHRDPVDGVYQRVEHITRGGTVLAAAIALLPLDTADLFATALGERD